MDIDKKKKWTAYTIKNILYKIKNVSTLSVTDYLWQFSPTSLLVYS